MSDSDDDSLPPPVQVRFRKAAKPTCNRYAILRDTQANKPKSCAQGGTLVARARSSQSPGASAKPDEKKCSPRSVRFSASELAAVQRKARDADCTVNGYIRAASLGSDYKPPIDPELRLTLLNLRHELTAQGNNLNQIAKHLNSSSSPLPSILRAIKPLAEAILRTLAMIRSALCRGQPAP